MRYLPVFLLFCQVIFAQNQETIEPDLLTKEQLAHDIDIMIQTVESIHPNVYLFSSEDKLENAEFLLRSKSEKGLTPEAFHIAVRQYLRHLSCGHTVARPSKEWYETVKTNGQFLPFTVFLVDNSIYINKAFDQEGKLKKGMQILEIDDKNIPEILDAMESIQERDGSAHSYVDYRIRRLFRTYYLFLYGSAPVYKLKVLKESGEVDNLTVIPGEYKAPDKEPSDKLLVHLKTTNAQFTISPENPEIGILDINRFSQRKFKKFYKSVFEKIANRNIEHLVLDLRNNGGGYFPNGNNLMRYLVDSTVYMHFNRPLNTLKKPKEARLPFFSKMTNLMFGLMPDKNKENERRDFSLRIKPIDKNHFSGKLYILTNGGTFSLSSYVSTYLKKYTNAVFIGSETGGGEYGSNAIIEYQLTLPESGIRVNVPYYFMDHKMPRDKNFGKGVHPNHAVNYTIEDLLGGEDLEKEKTIDLIEIQ